jgi:hypothetical protein
MLRRFLHLIASEYEAQSLEMGEAQGTSACQFILLGRNEMGLAR